ncbi:MAG: hypothetical protein R2882_08345 [Gemmatimonadales bacterium]
MKRLLLVCLGALGAGCGGGGGIAVPRPAAHAPVAVDSAVAWAAATTPVEPREIRFRFQARDDRGAIGGRGRVRLAAPDSARLDISCALAACKAAAFVSGDTAEWAEPEDDVRRIVPNYPLFWALLGVVRVPSAVTAARRYADATLDAWQYLAGTDTVDYVRIAGPKPRLVAEVREAGRVVGTVETLFGPDGMPLSARLIVPSGPARVDITFTSNQKAARFASETWLPDRP